MVTGRKGKRCKFLDKLKGLGFYENILMNKKVNNEVSSRHTMNFHIPLPKKYP